MKKILLLFCLFYFKAEAQFIDRGYFDASYLRDNITTSAEFDRQPNGCIYAITFNLINPELVDYRIGLGYVGYRYKFAIVGTKTYNNIREVIARSTISPTQYSSINENGAYVYSIRYYGLGNINLDQYKDFEAVIGIEKVWTNSDPGLLLFYSAGGHLKITDKVYNCLSQEELNKPDLKISTDDLVITPKYRENGVILISSGLDDVKIQNLEIKNVGRVTAIESRLSYYVTLNSRIDGTARRWKDFIIPSLAPGVTYTVPDHEFDDDDIGRLPNTHTDLWNILMKIDSNDKISETVEVNNELFLLRFKARSSKNTPGPVDDDWPIESEFKSSIKPYDLHVYNMYGQQIKQVSVKNKAEEKYIIRSLRNGLYILKSENGSRKIYVGK